MGPYRQHSDEFKRVAVARTLVDGASVRHSVLKLDLRRDERDLRLLLLRSHMPLNQPH